MEDFSKTVVAQVEGRDVTQGELSHAFDFVADRSNWKNPIDVVVVLSDRQVALVREAVVFFTGSVPTITKREDGAVRVVAAGYYAAVGA